MEQKRKKLPQLNRENRGFTLMELVVALSILGILTGMITVSTNVIPNFRVTRAAESVSAALDRTRTEAANRLVAEMELEYRSGDGYYITYYLDRGKVGSKISVSGGDTEKIAPANIKISFTDSSGNEYDLRSAGTKNPLILAIDRASGAFRPVQNGVIDQDTILQTLEKGNDISWNDSSVSCTSIIIQGGSKTRTISLNQDTGTYTVS